MSFKQPSKLGHLDHLLKSGPREQPSGPGAKNKPFSNPYQTCARVVRAAESAQDCKTARLQVCKNKPFFNPPSPTLNNLRTRHQLPPTATAHESSPPPPPRHQLFRLKSCFSPHRHHHREPATSATSHQFSTQNPIHAPIHPHSRVRAPMNEWHEWKNKLFFNTCPPTEAWCR